MALPVWCGICGILCGLLRGLAAVEASDPGPAPTAEAETQTYDPLKGIDQNGRIPKVPMPAEVPNPERWRYIPEGRIAPGNMLERFMITSFIAPIIYHEEDVGTGVGFSVTDIDFRHQRRREFAGIFAARSTEGQEKYSMVWKRWLNRRDYPGGGVIFEERSYARAQLSYEKTLTRRFFGLGPETKADDETSYTDEMSQAQIFIQSSLPEPGDNMVCLVAVRSEHHNLIHGHVSGRPTTGDADPDLYQEGDQHDSLWLTTGLRYDTRDSQHQPYRGWSLGMMADSAPLQSDDRCGSVLEAQTSLAIPIGSFWHDSGDSGEENPPTDTIAFGAFVQATAGDVPFWALPSLGGSDTLRGYIGNRFTDRTAWHAAAEYRFWPIPRGYAFTKAIRMERFGLAIFYELGTVAHDLDALRDAEVHDSYGFGLRMAFERTAVFRADFGFSDEDTTFTAAYGLSF